MDRLRVGAVTLAGLFAAVGALSAARAELPAMPKSPVVINVIDIAGNLALTQKAMENYRKAHPELVSRFTFTKAPATAPPRSAEELLAGRKAHPHRFMYARPATSGPGRTLLMGLPYLLGDSNPTDPISGWAKTWAFLKELNTCIEYYPSGTGATM